MAAQIEAAPRSTENKGPTPLHLAAQEGHLDTVTALVEEFQADLHAKDKEGKTPAELARARGHNSVADYLEAQAAAA